MMTLSSGISKIVASYQEAFNVLLHYWSDRALFCKIATKHNSIKPKAPGYFCAATVLIRYQVDLV